MYRTGTTCTVTGTLRLGKEREAAVCSHESELEGIWRNKSVSPAQKERT